jgi:serine/threonine-protein kinase
LIDSVVIPGDSRQRSNRAAIQTIAVVGAFLLLSIALVAWWFFRSRPGPTASPVDQTKAEQTQTLPPAPPDVSPGQPPSIAAPEGMVYVPGGSFRMGRRGGDRFEVPLFSVTIKPFFIDRTEVTNDEYLRFVKATGHRAPAGWPENWKDGVFPEDKLKLPVVNVSWDDANAYAKWAQKRLPTEAEWEFAARGDDGRIYPWGNEWSADRANAGRGDEGRILAVGSFANGASPYGALDMCGNVWEWTAGGLFNYARKSRLIASGKVIRGGAFDVPSERATATYRGVIPPDRMFDKTGFRCARDVK